MLGKYVDNGVLPGLVSPGEPRRTRPGSRCSAGQRSTVRRLQRDSLFRVASFTKPIVAAAAMILVDELRLSMDSPVDDLLPELAHPVVLRQPDGPLDDTVPAGRPITLRDLLTFRLGLGESDNPALRQREEELELRTFGPPVPRTPLEPDEWMRRLGTLPLQFQPGERWLYSTGSHVLGVLIARATGQPLEDFLRERIFEPLGMHDTGFTASDPARLTTAYVGDDVLDPAVGQPVAVAAVVPGREWWADLDRRRLPRVRADAAGRWRQRAVAGRGRGDDDRPAHAGAASGGRRLPRAGHRLGLRTVRRRRTVRLGRWSGHAVVDHAGGPDHLDPADPAGALDLAGGAVRRG